MKRKFNIGVLVLSQFRLFLTWLFYKTEKPIRRYTGVPTKDVAELSTASMDAFCRNINHITCSPFNNYLCFYRYAEGWKVFRSEIGPEEERVMIAAQYVQYEAEQLRSAE